MVNPLVEFGLKVLNEKYKEERIPSLKGSLFEEQKLRPIQKLWETIKPKEPIDLEKQVKDFFDYIAGGFFPGKERAETLGKIYWELAKMHPTVALAERWTLRPYETLEERKKKPITWTQDVVDLIFTTMPLWWPKVAPKIFTKEISAKIPWETAREFLREQTTTGGGPVTASLPAEVKEAFLKNSNILASKVLEAIGEHKVVEIPLGRIPRWEFIPQLARTEFVSKLVTPPTTPSALEITGLPTLFKQVPPVPGITTIPIIPTTPTTVERPIETIVKTFVSPYKAGQSLWNLDTGQKAKITRIDNTGMYIKFEGAVKEIKLKPGEEVLFTVKKPEVAEVVEKPPKEISLEAETQKLRLEEQLNELAEMENWSAADKEAMRDIIEGTYSFYSGIPLSQMTVQPAEDPIIGKLNKLLKQAKPLRGELETEYTQERGKRIREVERAIDEVGGEEGYRIALSKLKGPLVSPEAKIKFEPLKGLSQEDLDSLYNRTWKHPYLDYWEKISAANGLTNLLAGEIPQPKQLVLLEEIYGPELIKNILSKRALGARVTDFILDIANLPRTIMATADMSGFLRQGVVEVAAHPLISAKAMAKTFQFAFSPRSFKEYFQNLSKDPLYPLIRKSGLAITDPSRIAGGLTAREEAFISRLLQRIPIAGIIVRAAERSYVGFLNKLRVDLFRTWTDELVSKGFNIEKDRDLFRSAAEVINTFTGRGELGETLTKITPQLSALFFSPRLRAARFQALNPIWYIKQPKGIRIKAITDFAKFVGAGLTTLALIKLWTSDDIEVETDPRSSDFGKIRVGNTRWDIWGGFQQWARVFAQLITGQRKNTETGEIISLTRDEWPFSTRWDVLLRFIQSAAAPAPALIVELMQGAKTFTGEDITPETIVKEKFVPMYIQDIAEANKDGGLGRAIAAGIPAFFGIGVQTWFPRGKPKPEYKWLNKILQLRRE